MKTFTKTQMAIYLAAIFTAGLLTGWTGGNYASRHRFMAPPRPESMAEQILSHLETRLRLTPEQKEKVRPLVQNTCSRINTIHQNATEEIDRTVQAEHKELAALLSPEQRQQLETWDKERKAFRPSHKPGVHRSSGRSGQN